MRKKKYTIKPFEWRESIDDTRERYDAGTPFGNYWVERIKYDCEPHNEWEPWRWGYCFDEYYDEDSSECESLQVGKAKCWENWLSRITGALEEMR